MINDDVSMISISAGSEEGAEATRLFVEINNDSPLDLNEVLR